MALIPPSFLNSVVALGLQSPDGQVKYSATGFMYGDLRGEVDGNGEKQYTPFLVTNRHVFTQSSKLSEQLYLRFNRLSSPSAATYTAPLNEPMWFLHPDANIDVAVTPLDSQMILQEDLDYFFFQSDDHTFTKDDAHSCEVSEGDGVFVMGFPLGIPGEERNYPIVRQGTLARVRDWLSGNAQTFLIDASIFPGNSGGPVLLKPEAVSIRGTKRNDKCGLIGMVSSYLPYQEYAISEQTGRRRMIFEENSGLATVVPVDFIEEAVRIATEKILANQASTEDQEIGGWAPHPLVPRQPLQ